ncbi:nitrogen fixation protein FixH [Hasllibacter halocynthiae]|uniref:Nitrogen fixation protein FixH n=1 Tax=Hasllibacter halocynthiae TaxID=595589 RepID=A0A2T0X645_9RHOB|nr:FixH family protein [Hasllibacter halocynthiae]PRY94430.1 nitrogen fixation protein FixH [Hasllibacter halocynthiae]
MSEPTTQAERAPGGGGLGGRHVAAMFAGGFGIIVSVNLVLAASAVRTFPGTEVDSSYVASQNFDADRAAQDGLGWTLSPAYAPGTLRLAVTGPDGAPVRPEVVSAVLGRATTVAGDRVPAFAWDGAALVAPAELAPGNWNLRLELRAPDGTAFRRRIPIRVPR